MKEILCSTGAIIGRSNDRNYRLLKPFSEKLHCDGFEFMMYSAWYEEVDVLIDFLQSMRFHIPVMHCEKRMGEAISKGEFDEAYRLFVINCRVGREIGAGKMVVHLWDGLTSDANFQNNVQAYAHLRDTAEQHGLELLVENVVCNRQDPMKHWCELREKYPDIRFIYDTKMAEFHAQSDLLYQEEYAWLWQEGHIRHFHVNDYAGGYKEWEKLRTLPIGKGHVDFERFFEFVHKIGYEGTFTVEASAFLGDGGVDLDMLNEQFRYIREALKY